MKSIYSFSSCHLENYPIYVAKIQIWNHICLVWKWELFRGQKKNRKKTCQETTTNQKKGTSSQFNPSTLAALLGYNQPAGPTSPRVVLSGRRRIFRGSWWLVVHNHGARFCPLRIGLRDPFQMGFLWLKIGSPLTKWDDPPSRLPNTFPLKYLDHKNIPSKHRSPQEVWLED